MKKNKFLLNRIFRKIQNGSKRSIAMILVFVMLFSSITVTGNDAVNPASEVWGLFENVRFLLTFPEGTNAEDGAWLKVEKIHPDSEEYRGYTAAVKEGIDLRRESWAVEDGDFYSASIIQPDGSVIQPDRNVRLEIVFPADTWAASEPDNVRTVYFCDDIFEETQEEPDAAEKTAAPPMTKQVKDDGLHITFDLNAVYAFGVMKTQVPDGTPIEYLVPAEEDVQPEEGLMPDEEPMLDEELPTDSVEVAEDGAEPVNLDENVVQAEPQNEVFAVEVPVPEEGIIPEENELFPEALETGEQWGFPAEEGVTDLSAAKEGIEFPDEVPPTEMLPEDESSPEQDGAPEEDEEESKPEQEVVPEEESKPEQDGAPEDEVLLSSDDSDDEESAPDYEGAAGSRIVPVEGADYEIRVDYTAEAGIPAEAGFEAKAITEEDKDEWLNYGSLASRAVILSQDMSADEADNLVIKGIFDLTIFDPEGRVIEPKAPVHVSVGFADAEAPQDIIDAYAVHFPGTGTTAAEDTIYEEVQEDSGTSDGEIIEEIVSDEPQAVGTGSNNSGLVPEVIPAEYENGSVEFYAGGFSVYVITQTILSRSIEASDGNEYRITVTYDHTSGIPSDAELVVSEIKEGDEGYEEYVALSAKKLGETPENVQMARAFDIKIVDSETGEEYQPNNDVTVSIELLNDSLDNYAKLDVVHIHRELTGEGEEAEIMDSNIDGEAIQFDTDGFSVYVLIGYTVDFHWGEYTYSISGESDILLSTLLDRLGITEITLADVVYASFSTPALVAVEPVEGDWLLTSLAAFNTEETLTLVLTNGKSVEILVTDASLPVSGTWDNGSDGSGTWEIDEDGVMTISGTGKMIDFSASPWVQSTPWYSYIKDATSPVVKIVISDGITRIGTNSFTRARNVEEVDLTQCSTLESIGSDSFKMNNINNSSQLKTIKASNLTYLTTIELNAFNTDTALEEIDFSGCSSLTTIGEQAFNGDANLARVDFSDCTNLATIGKNAFANCSNITYLDVSGTQLTGAQLRTDNTGFGSCKANLLTLKANNCSQISGALNLTGYSSLTTLEVSGCANLTSITNIPASLESLDAAGCTGLTTLDLTDNTSLTNLDVTGDTGLATLSLPSSITTVSGLESCTGLNTVYYNGTRAEWNEKGFTVPQGATVRCLGEEELVITAKNANKVYDGTALTLASRVNNVTCDGLMDGHQLKSIDITGEQTDVGTGACTPGSATIIDANNTDVTNYYSITYKPGELTVKPKAVTVQAGGTKVYGDPDPDATVTGLIGEDTVSYTLSRADTGEDVGTYAVTVTGDAVQGNYAVTYQDGTLEITRASVVVTADDVEKIQGQPDGLTATVSGLKNGDDESVISYTLTRDDLDNEHSGTYVIVPEGEKRQGNYDISYRTGTLTIRTLTITFMNGETVFRTIGLEMGEPIGDAIDTLAHKDNYAFKGWFPADSDAPVTTRSTYTRDSQGQSGWLMDLDAETPEYVYEDTTLYARFTYTVRFEAEDATLTETERVLDEGAQVGELPIPVKEGYRFDGWLDPDGNSVEATTVFNGNTILTANLVEQITISFNPDGAELEETSRVIDKGTTAGELPELTMDGYVFRGWFTEQTGGEQVTAETTFDSDTTLYAHFAKQIQVTFEDEENNTSEVRTVYDDVPIDSTDLPTEPAGEDCSFDGWYVDKANWSTDSKAIAGTTIFTQDTTVYARYTVTVTFVVKDGNGVVLSSNDFVITKGASLGEDMPQDPVLAGYQFKGWFENLGEDNETQISASTTFPTHTTVTAKLIKQVTLAFLSNGTRHEYVVDVGDTVTLIENPIKTGWRFDGWFIADDEGEPNGRRITTSEGLVDDEGNLITDDQGNPVRVITVDEDMILAAKFVEQVNVRFVVVHPSTTSSALYPSINNEGSFVIDKTDAGLPVDESFYQHTPAVTGYYFDGWYHVKKIRDNATGYDYDTDFVQNGLFVIDGEVYALDESNPAYIPGESTTYPLFTDNTYVVAKLIKEITIFLRYQSEGDTQEMVVRDRCLVGKALSDYYAALVAPDGAAYREGYRIEWLRSGTAVADDYTIVAEDDNMVFDAHYIKEVTATFQDENGDPIQDVDGNTIQDITRDIDTALGALPEVSDTIGADDQERKFMGWFDSTGRQYTAETILTEDVTLKAKYGYEVTFGAEGVDDWSYTRLVESNTALGWMPGAPYREGYQFKNWTLDDDEIDETHVVTQKETYVGHYEAVSIYTVTVNYVIGAETKDTKIITVDRSAVSADNPFTVSSPTSFNQTDGTYYPVMTAIQIVPDDTTGLGVQDKHADVTVAVDSSDAKKITITVPYKIANARYTVRYMLKDLSGDRYTQIESVNLDGVIGARVTPEVKEYDYADFEHLETGTIEHASGDVFKVYYTRKYFTLSYNTMGGQVEDSVTALYGTMIDTLPTPIRTGYTFAGWYSNAETTGTRLNSITLNTDTTVYAKWTAKRVNYTIVYLFEKYNDAGSASSFEYDSSQTKTEQVGTTVYASSAPTITRTGWEEDTVQNSNSSVTIAADGSSVLYVYYKLREYTFIFRPGQFSSNVGNLDVTASLNGESKTGNNNYSYSFTAKLGQDIASLWLSAGNGTSRYGGRNYTVYFSGWQKTTGGSIYVTKRLTLTTDMLPNSGTTVIYKGYWLMNTVTYTVNYWLQNADNDGYTKSEAYSQTYNYLSGQSLSPKDITGYTFVRREDSGNTFNFYYNRDTFKIDYYYGSTLLDTISNVKFDATITGTTYNWTPTAAQCGLEDDYSFAGWYSDSGLSTLYTFSKMPSTNVILYAKWNTPSYTVTFHLNYDGANPEPYLTKTVEKHKTVDSALTDEELASLNDPTPAKEHHTFTNWYTAAEGGEIFDPAGKAITTNIDVYAHWKPKGVSYTVHYLRADDHSVHVLPDKTVTGNLVVGQEITEVAPYVTGYNLSTDDPDATMVADQGSITITLDYEDNEITFYYGKKPDTIKYSVYYLLWEEAHGKPVSEQIATESWRVAEPKVNVEVDGNYTSVTETAKAPVEDYSNYRPTKTTDTLALGTDSGKNILIFYYTKGAKLTVEYLDMEGDQIQRGYEGYLDVGETYTLDTVVNGYALDHIEKNDATTTDTSFTVGSITEEYAIRVYYKKNLFLLAHSANKPYDGTELVLEGIPANVTADGLKDGHTITGIGFIGSQTDVGMSECEIDPDSLVISGFKNGVTADRFYSITHLPGTLTVTKINVIISVEPDRWTGNVYDGTDKSTGFTNGTKTIDQYVMISNDQFKETYLDAYWTNLLEALKNNGRGYVYVEGALKDSEGNRTVTGLQILNERDVGDYYVESGIILAAATAALAGLADVAGADFNNYNPILYVRECRLEISPAPMVITTVGDQKPYDGTPLTMDEITVTVRGETVTPNGTSYTTAEGDTITITVTGSQLTPGESQNIYEIDWGTVDPENYSISETLGVLSVTKRAITIKADDLNMVYGADDPVFTVTVTYEADDGTTREIPAILTHWSGDNYTLRLQDAENGFTENIQLTITREEGEAPGAYVITPLTDNENFGITCETGKLVIGIARVSNDNGATWTYHAYLTNDTYDADSDDACMQGAFYRANALEGSVIIETLCETAKVTDNDDRYAMGSGFTFDGSGLTSVITSVTMRTTQDATFKSVITRGYSGGSLIVADVPLTLDDIIFDGRKEENFTGSIVSVADDGSLTVGAGAVLQNAKTEAGGGAINMAGGSLTMGGTIQNCESSGSGGAINMAGGSMTMSGTIQNCKSEDNGGAVYVGADASMTMSGTIQGCESGGSGGAVYVKARGSMTMTGGSITGNSSGIGGAIDVGGYATLTFSGNARVYDNLSDGEQKNVVLSVDDNTVINAGSIGSGAKIGVYVPDGETLFDKHGGVQDIFGAYTGSEAHLGAFVNDRNGLTGKAAEGNYIEWNQTIRVEVRYIDPGEEDYTGFPTHYRVMYRNDSYDPPADPSPIADIYQNLFEQYGESWVNTTEGMVPWLAFVRGETVFDDDVRAVISDTTSRSGDGKWAFEKGDSLSYASAGNQTLILYYTEPAYDLNIQKIVKEDTGVEKTFTMTLRSTAITRSHYIVVDEDGASSYIKATTASGDTPGSLTVKVKGESSVTVMNLGSGAYTIAEPTREYDVSARTSVDDDESFTDLSVSEDDQNEMQVTLDADRVLEITNTRRRVGVTIRKTVKADDTSGNFHFSVNITDADQPVKAFTIHNGEMPEDVSDDLVTNDEGKAVFTLAHNDTQVLTVPAGAIVEVKEDLTEEQEEKYAVFMCVPGESKDMLSGAPAAFEFDDLYEAKTLRVFNIPSICKVTDGDGSLLYFLDDGGTESDTSDDVYIPAIYSTIRDAFDNVGKFYTRSVSAFSPYDSEASEPHQIQMLVDYDVPAIDVVTVPAGYTMTFTTADRNARDGYPFRGTGDLDRAVLKRAETVDASFFTVSGATENNTVFTLKDIVLDGSAYPFNGMGGAINAENSIVTIDDCEIRNFEATDGGAVYTTGLSLTIQGQYTAFIRCISHHSDVDHGGGAVRTEAKTVSIDGAAFEKCEADDQGAAILTIDSTVTVNNATFKDCKSNRFNSNDGGGGAIYAKGGESLTITYTTFTNCVSESKGGAIFSRTDNMNIDNCTFTGCNSYGEGGAFTHFNAANTASASKPYLTSVKNSSFTGCYTRGGNGTGGAFQSCAVKLEVDTCEFENCHVNSTKEAGAVKHYNEVTGGETIISNSTFTHCYAPRRSGAVDTTAKKVTMTKNTFTDCHTPAFGGAISVRSTSDASIKECEFTGCYAGDYGGALNMIGGNVEDCTFNGCYAVNNGGAVYNNSNNTLTIKGENVIKGKNVVDGNETLPTAANGINAKNGGGVYVAGGSVTIEGSTEIRDCHASNAGGALYVAAGGSATITGGVISGNSSAKGGAVDIANSNCRLHFGGNPTIYDNYESGSTTQQKNVVLSADSNAVINTTSEGLTADAKIGVYAPKTAIPNKTTTLYDEHGEGGMPFGTSTKNNANINRFLNDWDPYLYGVDGAKKNIIYWGGAIARVSSDNGSTWKYFPALIDMTEDDIELPGAFNYADEQDEDVIIETLLETHARYSLPQGFTFAKDHAVTLRTTVSVTWNPDGIISTIVRGNGNVGSLLTVNGSLLTVEKITLEGNRTEQTGVTVDGGIINVSAGSLTVDNGATLQNSETTGNGGAVYVASGASMEMTGGSITGNSASKGGAVYVAAGGTVTLKDGEKAEGATEAPHATINGNTVQTVSGSNVTGSVTANRGAGIYLAEGAKLNIEGKPTFNANTLTDTDNYPSDPAKTNGGGDNTTAYNYDDGKVRQDIYVAGYCGMQDDNVTPIPATSIVVTGPITSGEGSIWVWCETPGSSATDAQKANNHYEMLKQFAVFGEGVSVDAAAMTAFRNAQDDAATGCGAKYLTGQGGVDIKQGTTTWKCIYWTGGFDFSFKKVDGFGTELPGAKFTLYKEYTFDSANKKQTLTEPRTKTSDPITAVSSDGSAKNSKGETIDKGIVLFEKVSPGIHFMLESLVPDGYVKTETGKSNILTKATDAATAVEAVGANPTVYVVLLGEAALKIPEDKAGTPWEGVLADIKEADIKGQTGEGDEARNYAIFKIDPDTGRAVAVPDIATYGILDESAARRKAILRKVEENTYKPLPNAVFEILRYDRTKVSSTDINGDTVTTFTSGNSGVYFIDKLPFGVYYLHETTIPSGYSKTTSGDDGNWFILTINENGVGYETDESEDSTVINTLSPETTAPD